VPEVNFGPFQSGIVFAITKLSAEPGLNMRRRQFLGVLGGAAAWPLTARSQRPAIPLVGVLDAGSATSTAREYEAFRSHLRQLGFVEGRNVRFEYRFANGVLDRLPSLAEELVQLNPSIVVSAPVPANIAVDKATWTIPIVMASGADPVGFGLVQSMSRPGGNVTGLTNFSSHYHGMRR
jgi:putative ABC transport system substrate-binding protein